ncbi:MAG: TIGR02147 family protein [Fibrobacterota bacterium]|nr:TIGR02147 family protein [Fibrobacterota bacterium]QQS05933.1 MAG: TIGR02147 family protein [Fibrobacterota bacterium]
MDSGSTPDIFGYLDYRTFLRDHYLARKEADRFFSYRQMALRTGVDAGWIAKVLQGHEHLSQRTLEPFCRLCKLGERESTYFGALVAFGKAKDTAERAEAFERVMSLKSPQRKTLGERQLAYYSRWYHAPIRSLLAMLGTKAAPERISRMLRPAVSVSEVAASIALLEELGLVKRKAKGWELMDAFVASPPEGAKAAVRGYQAQMMDLAKEALERHDPDRRDISSLTLSFDQEDMPLVRERLAAVRDSLIQLSAEARKPDVVYQVNLQTFPLSDFDGGAT